MYTNFDFWDEEQYMEEKLENFFGNFSSGIRQKLLAKNLVKPESLYDVYYPAVKQEQIKKNEKLFNVDLDEFSESIRQQQLSKVAEKVFSLEEQSEEFRKSLLVREKIHKDKIDFENISENKRSDLLRKNKPNIYDILLDSEKIRRNQVLKNKENINIDIEKSGESFREDNISKNDIKETNLEYLSDDYRDINVSKNENNTKDLENYNQDFLKDNITKNKPDNTNKDILWNANRDINISKNIEKQQDILEYSEDFKDGNLSKNVEGNINLEKNSDSFRQYNMSKNDEKNINLDTDSVGFLKDNISKNILNHNDIQQDSDSFRQSNISKNNEKDINLDDNSVAFRDKNLNSNKDNDIDIEKNSVHSLKDNLKNNINKDTSLEDISHVYRKDNISNNENKDSDIDVNSVAFRDKNISNNESKQTDLNDLSNTYRKDNISNNENKDSDIDNISSVFRDKNISNNENKETNLEDSSNVFRNKNISNNENKETDLNTESDDYRNKNLSNNQNKETDLNTESDEYRDNNLSNNEKKETNIESDSEHFRNNNISNNTIKDSDLSELSEYQRENLISKNVEKDSDLSELSEYQRENLISKNVEKDSDLSELSESARDILLLKNKKTDDKVDIADISKKHLDDLLSKNGEKKGGGQLFDKGLTDKGNKDANLKKNISSNLSIDRHVDVYGFPNSGENQRLNMLGKNAQPGMIGVNLMGLGTSAFIGVSRNWTQGLLFRNVLLLRNKFRYNTLGRDVIETGARGNIIDSRLYKNSMDIPGKQSLLSRITGFGQNLDLPFNPKLNDNIESFGDGHMPKNLNILSPIQRNLQNAFDSAIEYKRFNIEIALPDYSRSGTKVKPLNVDYGKDYNSKNEELNISKMNINTVIRECLKSANSFGLGSSTPINNLKFDADLKEIMKNFEDKYGFDFSVLENTKKSVISPDEPYINTTTSEGDVKVLFKKNENSIASKDIPGNPWEFSNEFGYGENHGKKGVKYIINKIAKEGNSDNFFTNFQNPQGIDGDEKPKIFIIGKDKNKMDIKTYQRYTIKNPYSSENSKNLVFYLENYSNSERMYFPPYISAFQNSSSANWNGINFLGRPEPVYVYNNSSRDGSITFFVLTDYAENAIISNGHDKNGNFKEKGETLNGILKENNNTLRNQQSNYKWRTIVRPTENAIRYKEIQELNSKKQEEIENNNNDEASIIDEKIKQIQKEIDDNTNDKDIPSSRPEYDSEVVAIKSFSKFDFKGNINPLPSNQLGLGTKEILKQLNNSLMFQPSYFSGSISDFKNRMEFIEKLTRPRGASGDSGFSFTKPPVCHMRLGDWIDHDVIINSTSFDYGDTVWTMENGQNQPMWATVTINFNIVGPAGAGLTPGERGVPLTSSDKEGYYGTKTTRK